MTKVAPITDAPLTLAKLRRELRAAADGLVVNVSDGDVTAEQLLEHLRCLAVVFRATDAGNQQAGKDPGPLRPHRTAVFHALADRGVTRADIAAAAGVTENAVGFAFRGTRRQRRADVPPPPMTEEAPATPRKRRERPES